MKFAQCSPILYFHKLRKHACKSAYACKKLVFIGFC